MVAFALAILVGVSPKGLQEATKAAALKMMASLVLYLVLIFAIILFFFVAFNVAENTQFVLYGQRLYTEPYTIV